MHNNLDMLRQRLLPLLEGKKIHTLSHLSQECDSSEQDIARALPDDICAVAELAEGDFEALWQGMTGWECATFIMQHGGSVVEIKGKLPEGKHGGGYFNLAHGLPLSGHIRSSAVTSVGFLSLPFMGLESHSLQFFDAQGAVLFGVYVGREKRVLLPAARDSYLELRARFAAGPCGASAHTSSHLQSSVQTPAQTPVQTPAQA